MLTIIGLAIFSLVILNISHSVVGRMENTTIGEVAAANQSMYDAQEVSETKTDYIIMGAFVALVLGIIITGYFATAHPIFMVFYAVGLIVLGVIAGILQYVWERLTAAGTAFNPYVTYLPVTNWVLTHLVLVMMVVGFIGLIMLFIGYTIRPEEY